MPEFQVDVVRHQHDARNTECSALATVIQMKAFRHSERRDQTVEKSEDNMSAASAMIDALGIFADFEGAVWAAPGLELALGLEAAA